MDNEVINQDAAHQAPSSPCEPPKRRRETAITMDTIEAVAARLAAMPPRCELTLESAVARLAPAIRKMQTAGYGLDTIARELTATGLTISGRTLARHLAGASAKRVRVRAK